MSLYGVIGYHVTFSEGHMMANHPIYGGDLFLPLEGVCRASETQLQMDENFSGIT